MCLHAGSQPQAAPDPWGSHPGPSLGLGTRATVGLGVLRLLCWWRRAVNGRAGVRGGNGRRGWGGEKRGSGGGRLEESPGSGMGRVSVSGAIATIHASPLSKGPPAC